ncbi:MAG TPA: glucoamylase family protein [Fimbriimonadaceae bacterium]|jgi:hypothetical protein
MLNRFCTAFFVLFSAFAFSQSVYESHVIFDNSKATGGYYYSTASHVAPSEFQDYKGKAPVDSGHFFTPPNALRLSWKSAFGGDWNVHIKLHNQGALAGDALRFWCYSEEPLDQKQAPHLILHDANGEWSPAVDLLGSLGSIPAKKWVQIVLPFSSFVSIMNDTGGNHFDAHHLGELHIQQWLDDNKPHTLWLDEITVGPAISAVGAALSVPAGVTAKGYDRHVDLSWAPTPGAQFYKIYRSLASGPFKAVATQRGDWHRYEDFIGASGVSAQYKISAVNENYGESPLSREVSAATHKMGDDELMSMVQEASFRYYWEGADPDSGMALESTPGVRYMDALGSSGFGVMALLTGVERGFLTRAQGLERLSKITGFLSKANRYHGAWSHYIDGRTGKTMAVFGKYDDGGDLVETAFMMEGLLAARGYFNGPDAAESALRGRITELWKGVEWDWYRGGPDPNFLYWHWSPDYGFYIHHPLIGWNETMICYLLGIASPTHPISASLYHNGWASQSPLAVQYRENWSRTTQGDHYTNGNTYFGHKLDVGEGNGAELFFTHFSFMGFDPRDKHDAYTDYFKNNRAIALISHDYSVANPLGFVGYGDDSWGRSAGINAHGGRPLPRDDNGTITCSAALSSMPYTPVESMKALKHFYRDLGDRVWGIYGFHDGFNQTQDWYEESYMALNEAPIAVMIENYRSGSIWKAFMSNPEIKPALEKIGFRKD